MRLGSRNWSLPLGVALGFALVGAARAQDSASIECPEMDRTIVDIVATETRGRADVTERLQCHFLAGTRFKDAAIRLESGGFEMLNKTERMFHRWLERGDEFVAKRWIDAGASVAEIRIVIHTENYKVTRFAAQYFAHPKIN